MPMTIIELLTLRHRAQIRWVDPCPGLDEQGQLCDVHTVISVTVDGAIKMRRLAIHELAKKRTATEALTMLQATEAELLIEHMAIHWADVVLDGTVIRFSEESTR